MLAEGLKSRNEEPNHECLNTYRSCIMQYGRSKRSCPNTDDLSAVTGRNRVSSLMFLMYQFENIISFIFHSDVVEGINTVKDIFPLGTNTIYTRPLFYNTIFFFLSDLFVVWYLCLFFFKTRFYFYVVML